MHSTLRIAVAVLALGGGVARAEPIRIAVVSLEAPPQLTFIGKSLSQALATEAQKAEGFRVMGPDEVESKLGRSSTAALVHCADDVRCLATQAAKLEVDRVIAGWLQKVGDAYKVAIVHVDVKSGTRVGAIVREVPIASRRLNRDVVAAAPALLAGEGDPSGVLVVETDVVGADVLIDGQPAGKTPVTRNVQPGKHKVQVSKPGYAAADPVWVEVTAQGTVRHHPRLFAIPARDRGYTVETKVEVMK